MTERKVKSISKVCPNCNKPFIAYKGLLIKITDQPCPHCKMTESDKYIKIQMNKINYDANKNKNLFKRR